MKLQPSPFVPGLAGLVGLFLHKGIAAADFTPAPQMFQQEIARTFNGADGLPSQQPQLLEYVPKGARAFVAGAWYEFQGEKWQKMDGLGSSRADHFLFPDPNGKPVDVPLPWLQVRQLLRNGQNAIILAGDIFEAANGKLNPLGWEPQRSANQIAISPEGVAFVASTEGLFQRKAGTWERIQATDAGGRDWAAKDVRCVGFDSKGQLWFGAGAGVGCHAAAGWKFFEGKDGLPCADFTFMAVGPKDEVWLGSKLGAIRFDGVDWAYRQGRRWLPADDVSQLVVDSSGKAWFATSGGTGCIERRPMSFAQKADFYEQEIEKFVKRTPYGYVAEAYLRKPGDKTSADPQDSDNDGLWTAMYGAGECFAYGATKDTQAKERSRKAFDALRFLQKVTQNCDHAPPKGFIARTIRPIEWPDPNAGRLASDRQEHEHDKLWKVYEPRWPKSADGKWYWKSDTSSDELDGHFFFYPLYYDLCADTEAERERVREVVRDVTDHLMTHGFCLVDHDGTPTRWAIYGPQFLNHDPNWWPERGLNSLSILTYLAVANHITGDPKYSAASRELIEQHGYAQNIMYPKVQHGPGSGNQSDDEMAFMCYYGLLHCSTDDQLRRAVRLSFFHYWANEAPEMNPFFNFAYAAHNLGQSGGNVRLTFSLQPWPGWHEDALATLRGFSLDRLNWPQRNSHRLDLVFLPPVRSQDLEDLDRHRERGHRINGKVLPIENRHFNHWNTDPWQLDYGGNGNELAAGTVFLLPYYMGLYHGFIEKPAKQ